MPGSDPSARSRLLVEIGVVLCLTVVPNLAYALLGASGNISFAKHNLALTIAAIQIVVPLLYIIHRSGEPWSKFGLPVPAPRDLLAGAVLFGFLYVLQPVLVMFVSAFETGPGDPALDFPRPSGAADYLILVPALLVCAFWEELALRGYLIPRLRDVGIGNVGALLISSALFASYHIYQGASATAYIFLWGMLLGVAFLNLPRVWPLTLAHALTNFSIA